MSAIENNEIKAIATKHNVSVHIVAKNVRYQINRGKDFTKAIAIIDQHIGYDKNRVAETSYKNRSNH